VKIISEIYKFDNWRFYSPFISSFIFFAVLQSLNQRPGQPMNMPGMQNKMPGINMIPTQGGPMSHMGPIQSMQNNPMLTQINQMGQGNIPQQMNQMVPGQMGQLAAGQMQQNMQVYFNRYILIYNINNIYIYINFNFIYIKRYKKDTDEIYIFFYSPKCKINYRVR